jgi:microcystin degradation protein MlrC
MARVLIAELQQETATFNPHLTQYEDFRVERGAEIVDELQGTNTEIAGALDVFDEAGGIEVVPTVAAWAVPHGPVADDVLDRLIQEIMDAVEQNSDVDAVLLVLHGAMAGESEFDPEGRLLAAVRECVGAIPIVGSLDFHAVITDRMLQTADLLVGYHTYPHTDFYETGARAARNLVRLLRDDVKPTTARVSIPLLTRGDEILTATGRFGDAIRLCQAVEASTDGLAANIYLSNPFTDVPDLQTYVIVSTDNDEARAIAEAEKIAAFMWENRDLWTAELSTLPDAIAIAKETDGLTVFSDAADATTSGAPGDSNAVLKGLLEQEYEGRAVIPLIDAPAVAAAFVAGVGSTIKIPLGGTLDPGRHTPFEATVYVKSLHDGEFTYENGVVEQAGRTAVLTVGNIVLLVAERLILFVGLRVFQAFGLEPRDFSLLVAKSPNGFRTWYDPIASRTIHLDTPGSASLNLESLPYERCVRPIYPLDKDVFPELRADLPAVR